MTLSFLDHLLLIKILSFLFSVLLSSLPRPPDPLSPMSWGNCAPLLDRVWILSFRPCPESANKCLQKGSGFRMSISSLGLSPLESFSFPSGFCLFVCFVCLVGFFCFHSSLMPLNSLFFLKTHISLVFLNEVLVSSKLPH